MRTQANQMKRFSMLSLLSMVLFSFLLMGTLSTVEAVDYYVFGQVFQISSEDAANASIVASDLTGDSYPFAHIRIYDQESGALLGDSDAGQNGQFTVIFDLPAGSSPDIECRVYRVVDGESTLLPDARDGINSFTGIGQFHGVGLKVVSDEIIDYGDAGFRSYPGVGLVFTRVGKVEIPYISQDTTLVVRPVAGLADFTGNETRASELGVYPFKQAPFASRLLIFGDFGLPGGICTGDQIDWYQVKIKKIRETGPISYESEIDWKDPMHKTKTEVTTVPMLSVKATTEKIGPFDGALDDPFTVIVETDPIYGLYWVNRNEVGVATNIFYSFPDLRVNWLSNAANGLYELSLVYFKEVGRTSDNKPIVQEIPATCFAGSPPPADAADVALHKLVLRVNNQPLNVRFDHIYLKDPTSNEYFAGEGNPDTSIIGDALDFNAEGLCDIMHLQNKYQVEVHFTAHHEGQYLDYYNLYAISNDNNVTVNFDYEKFTDHTTATNPLWAGTPASGKSELKGGFTKDCAYRFRLRTNSRLQDGYHRIQWAHPDRAYYVMPLN